MKGLLLTEFDANMQECTLAKRLQNIENAIQKKEKELLSLNIDILKIEAVSKEAKKHKEELLKLLGIKIKLEKLIRLEIQRLKVDRMCCMRLCVIERYILPRMWAYPLEISLDEDSEHDFSGRNIQINLKSQKESSTKDFFISIAVSARYISKVDKIVFDCFAELMIRQGEKYYYRNDFGLEANEREKEKINYYNNLSDSEHVYETEDMVFEIENLRELDHIFQKFDSWFGSGMD